MGFVKEFKEFAMKGNVMDMAVGVVAKVGDATVKYGTFIQNIIDFLIIALCIFCMIKAMNKLKKQEEPAPEAPAGPTTEELLADIKDILKNK